MPNVAVHIVDGMRTPFAKMGTDLAQVDAVELGRVATTQLLARLGLDPAIFSEVIFGCVSQPPDAANIARVLALRSGIPVPVPAITVHRNCASGFESITQAFDKMQAGRGEVFLVGGTESMSQIPMLYKYSTATKFSKIARSKTFKEKLGHFFEFRPADFQPIVGIRLGLTDPICGLNMGQTAENLARDFGITRQEADEFSLRSHQRATAASERLKEEITPVYLPDSKPTKTHYLDHDNGPRAQQSLEALAKLKPTFEKTGIVTAGNSSQITDGAVALVLATEDAVKKYNLPSLGRLVGYDYAGCDPSRMGLGPVYAIARAQKRYGLGLQDADLIEINEAFAAQVIACQKASVSPTFCKEQLGLDVPLGEIPDDKLNVNGGAVALGHPVGSTGARLVLTILKELARRNAKRGLASLCVGGGQGGALWLER